jgi:hypothetical protein
VEHPVIRLDLLRYPTFRAAVLGGSLFRIGTGAEHRRPEGRVAQEVEADHRMLHPAAMGEVEPAQHDARPPSCCR